MCLATAKQGQLQPNSKTRVQDKNNVIKSAIDIRDKK
jgi:hypothetical protein